MHAEHEADRENPEDLVNEGLVRDESTLTSTSLVEASNEQHSLGIEIAGLNVSVGSEKKPRSNWNISFRGSHDT